jgi:hypothetical protein
VIHDHCACVTLAMADRIEVPVVAHGARPFTEEISHFYASHGNKGTIVCLSEYQLSQAPAEFDHPYVVPNPIEVQDWPFSAEHDEYLLWIGPHATRTRDRTGRSRRLARRGSRSCWPDRFSPARDAYFATDVEPHIDGKWVRYLGRWAPKRSSCLFAGHERC